MSSPVVLIADADQTFAETLCETLVHTGNYSSIYTVNNMEAAISLMNHQKIDILITELFIFNGDGLTLLSHFHRINRNSVIVLVSPLARSDIFTSSALKHVDMLFAKPCAYTSISDALTQMLLTDVLHVRQHTNMDNDLSEMIRSFGISPHMKGYRYLKEAVVLVLEASPLSACITKHIYPEIARNNLTNPGNVERSIRYAIKSAWSKEHSENWELYFSTEKYRSNPSNAAVIHAFAEYYRIHGADIPATPDTIIR